MPSCVSCPLSSPVFSPLAPSVCCIVPFMFSLCSSPSLPHLASSSLCSPVPHLVISVCVFSLCVSLHSWSGHCLVCILSMLFLPGMFWIFFAFCFELCYLVCTLTCFLLVATLPLAPVLSAFGFWTQL